ncbi:MAG: hypothetical protein V7731_06490 [Amphritea sp.]
MSRAFVVFFLVLMLSPFSILTDRPVAVRHSDIDASFSFSTPGVTQFSVNFWRWGRLAPKWRDTYEVLLEAEMIAVSGGFGERISGNRTPDTIVKLIATEPELA